MGSPFLSRRREFDLPDEEIYLDGAYMSPLPHAARSAVDEAYRLSSQPYRVSYSTFFEYTDAVRERIARLLGFPTEEIGITSSCGDGASYIALGLDWQPGDRVLLGPDEFPANVYPWLGLRDRGVKVEFIGERGTPLRVSQLESALEQPGRVRLLSIAAVYYLTGDLHPLAAFSRLLHAREARLVVDATQATGCVAMDWRATGADALLSSGYKWLLGPYGTGCVWMNRSLLEQLRNVGGNWWANEKARDLRELLTYAPVPVHGARLDSGETASFLNLAAVQVGLDYLLECGVDKIEAHHRALHDRLADQLKASPLEVVTQLDGKHRSPMFFLRTAGDLAGEKLQAELAKAHIRVSLRGGKIRVSPGVWSQAADVDALAETIGRVTTEV